MSARHILEPLLTFVFEEVAHACSTRKHELGDILDDLRFVLRRECGEPFREALKFFKNQY